MRKVLGTAICVVGVGALGLYGTSHNAKEMQSDIGARASASVSEAMHGVRATTSGRDIILTGLVNDTAERDALIAKLDAVDGRRVVLDQTEVLPQQSPFTFEGSKAEDGTLAYSGFIPSEDARKSLGFRITNESAAALTLAAGAPDAAWPDAASIGAKSLGLMESGSAVLSDTELVLTGVALNPAAQAEIEAPLADLPEGYTATVNLELLDDGKPFSLRVSRDETGARWTGGKLPASMEPGALATALGQPVEGDVTVAKVGQEEETFPILTSKGLQALAALKSGELVIEEGTVTLTGMAATPTEAAVVEAALSDLPEGFTATPLALDIEDDGTPFRFSAVKSADGVTANGKLPAALAVTDLPGMLSVPFAGEVQQARIGGDDTAFSGTAQAGLAALDGLKTGTLEITEEALTLSGLAANPDAVAAVDAALATVPDGFAKTVNLDLEDDGKPMDVLALKDETGIVLSGKAPASAGALDLEAVYGGSVDSEGLAIARIGADDAAFAAALPAGLTALSELEAGALRITDQGLSLTGAAIDPEADAAAKAALAALPDGAVRELSIDVMDDGLPFGVTAVRDGAGVTITGKAPGGLGDFDYAAAYGGDVNTEGLRQSRIGSAGDYSDRLQAGLQALAALDAGTLTVTDDAVTLDGTALNPTAQEAVTAALATLPEGSAPALTLDVLDDGVPFGVTAIKDENGTRVTGKAPAALSGVDLGAVAADELAIARIGGGDTRYGPAIQNGLSALDLLETGALQVDDTALRLTGAVRDPSVAAQVNAILPAPAEVNLDVLDDGTPFTVTLTKARGGAITAKGKVPAAMAGYDFGEANREALAVSRIGGDDTAFAATVPAGLAALEPLNEGTVVVTADSVGLTGVANGPTEEAAAIAALDALPDAMTVNAEILLLDDGVPPNYSFDYSASDGATLSGKLPMRLSADDFALATGLDSVTTTDVTNSAIDDTGREPTQKALAAVAPWMPELESLRMALTEDGGSVEVEVTPGADRELIEAQISEDLGDAAALKVSVATIDLPEGSERVNAATQEKQLLQSGIWLPALEIDPTLARCTALGEQILERTKVNFLSGSDRLDAQSVRGINRIAVLAKICTDAGLTLEVGGHTDSVGNADANLALSQRRADAVVAALQERGISQAGIVALGYGAAQPIATNDTAEGRAQNRRTTLSWTQAE